MLAKIEVMVKTRENRGEKPKQSNSHHPISATVGNISITSQSSFYAYYISFQILGSQESIGSNGSRFGVETKKLWPFEDDCAKLNGNVAAAPHFCYCWTRFRSTLWSSNYAYHMSFWSLGSQESSASNGVRFGFETKKLWPFERIQFCIWAGE